MEEAHKAPLHAEAAPCEGDTHLPWAADPVGEDIEAPLDQVAAAEEEVASLWAGGPVWEACETTPAASFPSVRREQQATWV